MGDDGRAGAGQVLGRRMRSSVGTRRPVGILPMLLLLLAAACSAPPDSAEVVGPAPDTGEAPVGDGAGDDAAPELCAVVPTDAVATLLDEEPPPGQLLTVPDGGDGCMFTSRSGADIVAVARVASYDQDGGTRGAFTSLGLDPGRYEQRQSYWTTAAGGFVVAAAGLAEPDFSRDFSDPLEAVASAVADG